MNYTICLPNYGDAIRARGLSQLRRSAERAGWDGFYLFDHILVSKNQGYRMIDP